MNQTRRSKEKYSNLKPQYNLRSRTEVIDYDYLDKLNDKEKAYLNKFNKEYVNASLDVKSPRKNLHKNKALIKDCHDRNNARNRDVLTMQKAMHILAYIEDNEFVSHDKGFENFENRFDMQQLGIINENGDSLVRKHKLQVSKKLNRKSSNRRKRRKKRS